MRRTATLLACFATVMLSFPTLSFADDESRIEKTIHSLPPRQAWGIAGND